MGLMRWKQLDTNESATYPYRFMADHRDPLTTRLYKLPERQRMIDEVERWCRDQYPNEIGGWFNDRWRRQGTGFMFRNYADAVAFKMRWV
jgi:hypothetical protein